ncbi:MAG: DUF308 domain-containing protein [Candidatus Saccharibacteria bacterium]|nr:DUF308 domain-containing protein [Candidatus Saccharibacteria bacterium]MDO4987210.1 DUF308 domain-containing protein [Candidatus Saccharibacteria bacterium]
MQKQIKSYLNASIITSAAFVLLGLIFIVWPSTSLDVIRWIISISALAIGAYLIALDFTREKSFSLFNISLIGTLLVILGVVFAINPGVMNIFPVILGAWFVVSSVSACKVTTKLKGTQAYAPSLLAAVLSLVAGIVLIINPWAGSEAMMMFVGIVMVIHSVSNLTDMFMLKKNLKTVQKKVKDVVESIQEGEIKK